MLNIIFTNSDLSIGVINKMRNELIMITAMLAVMVAMTGTAAAAITESVSPNQLTLSPEGTGTTTVTYTGISANSQINWWLENDDGNPATELKASDGGLYAFSGNYNIDSGVGRLITVQDLTGTNTQSKYWLVTCLNSNCNRFRISVEISSIPEFPTVALPVAAVIGLVFLFQQRKNKKE